MHIGLRVSPVVLYIVIIAGATVGVATSVARADCLVLALALVSVAVALADPQRRRLALFAVAFAASLWRGAEARDAVLEAPLRVWFDRVASDSRSASATLIEGALAGDASASDDEVRLMIRVRRLFDGGAWRAIGGVVQAHVSGERARSPSVSSGPVRSRRTLFFHVGRVVSSSNAASL